MYLHNKDLFIEIIVSKAQGKLTNKSKLMLEILAKRTIKKMRYYNNDDRMDCYQSGLLDMFSNWYNFNEEKSDNAFALTRLYQGELAQEWTRNCVSLLAEISMISAFCALCISEKNFLAAAYEPARRGRFSFQL